jgi:protocatechuate 3,4-dioxygenase alpha subunit
MAGETPFQTVGPFFHFALDVPAGHVVVSGETTGTRVSIEGTVRDGGGDPIPDALIETWQANAAGRYHHPDDVRDLPVDPSFDGFGRAATDRLGGFVFDTIKPGRVPGPDGRLQAPHIMVSVLGRGILTRLVTRIYFDDEPAANGEDSILGLVPAERRPTLVARHEGGGRYHFDIVVQGANETVFFDV